MSANKNKFIAFNLSDEIIDEYYSIAIQIAEQLPNFVPMSREDIHMTVVYLGNIYNNFAQNKISAKEKMNLLNIKLAEETPISNLAFDDICLFTQKQNLIVAKFKFFTNTSSEYKQIINLKRFCSENYFAPSEDFFEPHITLGKISGANDNDRKLFIETIKPSLNKPNIEILNDLTFCIKP